MKAPPLTREPAAVPDLRRKCSCGDKTGCEECKAKAGRLDRRAVGPGTPGAVPPVVHEVLRSPGEPLDPAARAFFEPRFGHDFGRIRVHSGPRAAASAAAVNARAYTVGRHIVLGDPGPVPPTLLLAHELAHTVQQGDRAGDPAGLRVTDPGDRAEAEADAAASAVLGPAARPAAALGPAPAAVARVDCTKMSYNACRNSFARCGYQNSGTCGWTGIAGGCKCLGAKQPSAEKVLEVLLIVGVSILLLATVVAALLDPEPATKLGLAGLSAAEIALLLSLLGYGDDPGPTADVPAGGGDEVA